MLAPNAAVIPVLSFLVQGLGAPEARLAPSLNGFTFATARC